MVLKWSLGLAWVGSLGVALACAPTQIVPMGLEPAPVEVFVDGRRLEEPNPSQVELRADRGHVLQFERAGYRSEQVILISGQWEGRPHLQPEEIFVQLLPLDGRKPEVEVELEPSGERGVK